MDRYQRLLRLYFVCGLFAVSNAFPTEPINEAPCPTDSILVDGLTCRCNHDLCPEQPPCDKNLELVKNRTDIPGECCAIYSCPLCSNNASDLCVCPMRSSLNSNGQCECDDPHESIINGECVCDEDRCPKLQQCDGNSVQIKVRNGCCITNVCKTCPTDSYPYTYNTDEVEDKCVCFPCRQPDCGEHTSPFIIKRGTSFPGTCCDLYECRPNTTCTVNGTSYQEGDVWHSHTDGACECREGIALCSKHSSDGDNYQHCFVDGEMYEHLSTWMEDSCTNCTCLNGTHKCISHLCDVKIIEVKKTVTDCPSMSTCKTRCALGYKLNKFGCETCRCRIAKTSSAPHKFVELEKILAERNLSETDVINALKMFDADLATNNCTLPGTNALEIGIMILGLVLTFPLLVFFLLYIFKRLTSYSYSLMNHKKEQSSKEKIPLK